MADESSGRKSGRMDLATLAGAVVALGAILGGLVLEGGKLADIAQLTAALGRRRHSRTLTWLASLKTKTSSYEDIVAGKCCRVNIILQAQTKPTYLTDLA